MDSLVTARTKWIFGRKSSQFAYLLLYCHGCMDAGKMREGMLRLLKEGGSFEA